MWSESSAFRRTGTGRLRHLEIRHTWTQERLQKGVFLLKAVPTDENVTDLVTKHLAAARVEELLLRCRSTTVDAGRSRTRDRRITRPDDLG